MTDTSHRLDYVFLFFLTLLYAFSYLDAAIILDNARDFYKVEQIVTGNQLILQGSDLASAIHLSAWWFYWLSIVGIAKIKWLIALWAGLTAGLKFVFAYQLGQRLFNKQFAYCVIFSMTLPGWQSLEQFTFSHTNVVQALTLLFGLLLWHLWYSRDGRLLKWLSLVFSLAIHAHPSTYGLLVFAIPFLLVLLIRKTFSISDIFWAVLFAVLAIVPYVIQQYLDNWHDFQTAGEFGKHQFNVTRTIDLLSLWDALFRVGPLLFAEVIAGNIGWWEKLLHYGYCLVSVVSLLGYVKGAIQRTIDLRRLFLFGWALFALSTCVLVVRDITPFYMTYVLLPVVAIIMAYGFCLLIDKMGVVFYAMNGVSLVLIASTWFAMVRFSGNNELALPDWQLRQVTAPLASNWREQPNLKLDIISFRQSKSLDDFLCQHRQRQLHGPMVAVLDLTFGAPTQFICDADVLGISGDEAGYALLSGRIYHTLETQLDINLKKIANYAIIDTVIPLKPVVFSLAQPNDYQHPPRGLDTSTDSINLSARLEKGTFIMITDYLSVYRAFSEPKVSVNQHHIEPIAQNYYTRVYFCMECQENKEDWKIAIDHVNRDTVDIVYWSHPL